MIRKPKHVFTYSLERCKYAEFFEAYPTIDRHDHQRYISPLSHTNTNSYLEYLSMKKKKKKEKLDAIRTKNDRYLILFSSLSCSIYKKASLDPLFHLSPRLLRIHVDSLVSLYYFTRVHPTRHRSTRILLRNTMAATSGIQKLKGTWEYVDGEHFDDYMKELGVGFALRQSAKLVKPKLIITENGGKWSFKSESTLKTASYEFTPGMEFDETRLDGESVKVNPMNSSFFIHTFLFSSVPHQIRKR